jgi:hypothetical protein
MARISVSLKAGSVVLGAHRHDAVGRITDPLSGATYATDKTAFEAALAALVADGATPTQAHVTTANNAYTTFKADLAAPPTNRDVVLSFETTAVVTKTYLRRAVEELLLQVAGGKELAE